MKKIDKLRGQHTIAIAGQVAGLSDAELKALAKAEVAHSEPTRPSVLQSVWREQMERARAQLGHGV